MKEQIEQMVDDLMACHTEFYENGELYTDYPDMAANMIAKGWCKQEWISVKERLPEEGKCVIVWVGSVQVAMIEKGITEEERQKMKNGEVEDRIEYGWSQSTGCIPLKRSNLYRACDVHGNNRVPYCWKANGGPMEWFGQNVTHWIPLPEAPKMKGGAE
jgi:hypothetical protein